MKQAEDNSMKTLKLRASTALTGPAAPKGKDPKMGDFTFRICRTVQYLGANASGLAIYEFLESENYEVNTAQMYGTIQRLLEQEIIARTGTSPSKSGPPLKLYELTKKGVEMLQEKSSHLHELVGFDNRLTSYEKAKSIKGARHGTKGKGPRAPRDYTGRSD
jgi:DNA-binding PadR family transcriptional regulator